MLQIEGAPLEQAYNKPFSHSTKSSLPSDTEYMFEDTDSAYNYWLSQPFFKESTQKETHGLIPEIMLANRVQLHLQGWNKTRFKSNIMHQHSTRITIFDALILWKILKKNQPIIVSLDFVSAQANKTDLRFSYDGRHSTYCEIDHHNWHIDMTNLHRQVGSFSVEIEKNVIEKIYGTFKDQGIIVDPIWKNSQSTLASMFLSLGSYQTEILYSSNQKDTVWRSSNGIRRMSMIMNRSIQINENLWVNRKVFQLGSRRIRSIQWFCPWLRFPILGNWLNDYRR